MPGVNARALNSALNNLGLATGLDNGDTSSNGNLNNAFNSLFGNSLLNASDLGNQQDALNNGSNNAEMANQLRQLISNLPGLNNLMNNGNDDPDDDEEQMNNTINNNNNESTSASKKKGEFALDLSKPLNSS